MSRGHALSRAFPSSRPQEAAAERRSLEAALATALADTEQLRTELADWRNLRARTDGAAAAAGDPAAPKAAAAGAVATAGGAESASAEVATLEARIAELEQVRGLSADIPLPRKNFALSHLS